MTHDIDRPVGGIRVFYEMVDSLNRHGIDAAVWHGDEGFRLSWFANSTRIIYGHERVLDAGDLLAVHELNGAAYQPRTVGADVVVVNQGHFHTFFRFGWERVDSAAYPGWPNAVAALATSRTIDEFLHFTTPPDFPVYHVPLFDPHVPAEETWQPMRRIAALTTRLPDDMVALRQLVLRSPDMPSGWEFVGLSGLSPVELRAELARTAVFVSSADHDGFSLPALEAMGVGALVVGFTGTGAREYLREPYAVPVDSHDLVALARAVIGAAQEFERDPRAFAVKARLGRDHARAAYSRTAFDTALVGAFQDMASSGLGTSRPVTVRHYAHGAGPRPLPQRAIAAARHRGARIRAALREGRRT